jgi:uncharacterized integral membrane protein
MDRQLTEEKQTISDCADPFSEKWSVLVGRLLLLLFCLFYAVYRSVEMDLGKCVKLDIL